MPQAAALYSLVKLNPFLATKLHTTLMLSNKKTKQNRNVFCEIFEPCGARKLVLG